jgi:prefoldin subunit 5
VRSNWYNEELQKAILGYRDTIAALENMKKGVQPWDRSELWWDQLERQIQHLKQSIASLEDVLGTASIRPESQPSPHR